MRVFFLLMSHNSSLLPKVLIAHEPIHYGFRAHARGRARRSRPRDFERGRASGVTSRRTPERHGFDLHHFRERESVD